MSEHRRPDLIFTIRHSGKRARKVELFRITQWRHKRFVRPNGKTIRINSADRYRIRVGGRWFRHQDGSDLAYSSYEFRDLFWREVVKIW